MFDVDDACNTQKYPNYEALHQMQQQRPRNTGSNPGENNAEQISDE